MSNAPSIISFPRWGGNQVRALKPLAEQHYHVLFEQVPEQLRGAIG